MKIKKYDPYKVVTLLFPIILIFIFVTQNFIVSLVTNLPPCPVYAHYHLYCPACGNTRSVIALLHGDLVTAIKYNISPIVFGVFIILAYIEMATYSFGRHLILLPRKLRYYLIIISILVLYVSVRNFIPGFIPR